MKNPFKVSLGRRLGGWLIHTFTASGAFLGILSLYAAYQHTYLTVFWLMLAAILIDAVDGMLARMIKIKVAVPQINGEVLDNIVDFLNYTIVPSFFLLVTGLLPPEWRILCVMAITFSSAYQFSQVDAKTQDHFFKGFPSYWNIAVFYLFFWQFSPLTNVVILFTLAILSFVPIKYVYPSRLEYLTRNTNLRLAMLLATILWGASVAGLLWIYPLSSPTLVWMSLGYLILYVAISLYRTWVPLASS